MSIARKEYSRILALGESRQVKEIGDLIIKKYEIRILRPAQKTLTMIQMREPVGASLFYLGEALCCECMIEINEKRGCAVMMGDDYGKVTAAAVIDGAFQAELPECSMLEERIMEMAKEQAEKRAKLNAEILKSRVSFHTMGGQ